MTTHIRKTNLRWIVPLLIYYVVLTVLLVSYRNYYYSHVVRQKEIEMAFAVEKEIDSIDYSFGQALTSVYEAGTALSLYAFRYNRNQIELLLNRLITDTDISDICVCDLEGNGYDYHGKDVRLQDEDFFSEVTEEYSRGGIGIVFPDTPEDQEAEVYIVNGISFNKKERGYIIASIPVVSVAEHIFSKKFEADMIAVVTIDGKILAVDSGNEELIDANRNLYDILPKGTAYDNIKLSISQKSIYYADAPGYGYLIVLPFDTMGGGAVVLLDYDDMRLMANREMLSFKYLVLAIIVASVLRPVLVFIANALGDFIQKKRLEKRSSVVDRDVITGLLTSRAAVKCIDEYLEESDNPKGMLFALTINLSEIQKAKESFELQPERIKEFADSLTGGFRSTDIIARTGDNEFMVFLRNLGEDKDVRRQTDHMQMFLHDSRMMDEGTEVCVNAGAAICRGSGTAASELMAQAREALERSMEEGPGRLSF